MSTDPSLAVEPPPRRVLVVDDDHHAVTIVTDFLEAQGFSVTGANDGHEALARFHDDGPFDVIVLDVMMPGIDGMEVCRRIKGTPQGQLTPVALLSARSDTRSRIAGLYGGADDYMTKPVDLRELEARVKALIRVRDRYIELATHKKEGVEAAITDGLSGVANRQYFLRRLEEEIARCDRYKLPMTVVVADLVGLPEPSEVSSNEDWGALDEAQFEGPADKLLAAVGEVISANIRTVDLVARLRRSRYAIMLPHTPRRAVEPMNARLRAAVAAIPADADREGSPPAGLDLRLGVAELKRRMDALTLLARAEPQ
ncbi:MAG: response regulator [Deltaproteobacteria bacterium]|nr:response regulator [Deltaproteobacteria bacterium]